MIRAFLASLAALALTATVAPAATLYTDTFDATAVGSVPTGWSSVSGAWQVTADQPSSGHTKSFTATGRGDGSSAILTGATASADMEVTYSFVMPTTATASNFPAPGPMLRMNSGYTGGYVVLMYGGYSPTIVLFRRSGGGFSNVGSTGSGQTFTAGNKVNVRAQIIGSAIKVRIWKDGTTEPTSWALNLTDTNVTAAGYTGFYYGTDGASSPVMGVTDMTLTDTQAGGGGGGGGGATISVPPNDASLVYSPWNWNVTATAAATINSGAYFKTFTTSATATLNFDITNNAAPLSQIEYRVDAYDTQSPWKTAPVAATVPITMPSDLSAAPYHLLEVRVKSTSETINRWNAPSNTAVVFTGLTLANGATSVAPVISNKSVIILGDSITEAVRTVNSTATNDTDRNAISNGWSYKLGELLGAEVGVVGFGGSGLAKGGSGNVPALPTSIQSYFGGAARSFTPVSLVVINMGTNDGDATATAAGLTSVLNFIQSKVPGTPVAVLQPFNGNMSAALQNGIAAASSPSMATYVSTSGFQVPAYGIDNLNLHPLGPNNAAIIAPKVANAVRQIIYPSTGGGGGSSAPLPGFRPGFH